MLHKHHRFYDYPGGELYREELDLARGLSNYLDKLFVTDIKQYSRISTKEYSAYWALIDQIDDHHRPKQKVAYMEAIKALCPKHLPQPRAILGNGLYGTAFSTTDHKWVLKITNSPYEVDRLHRLLKEAPELVCKVLHIEQIGSEQWLIWKE